MGDDIKIKQNKCKLFYLLIDNTIEAFLELKFNIQDFRLVGNQIRRYSGTRNKKLKIFGMM